MTITIKDGRVSVDVAICPKCGERCHYEELVINGSQAKATLVCKSCGYTEKVTKP